MQAGSGAEAESYILVLKQRVWREIMLTWDSETSQPTLSILAGFRSTCHKLQSLERREPPVRNRGEKISL